MYCERKIKAVRKDHQCESCRSKILKGESAIYVSGLVADDRTAFGYYYLCTECHAVMESEEGRRELEDCDNYLDSYWQETLTNKFICGKCKNKTEDDCGGSKCENADTWKCSGREVANE